MHSATASIPENCNQPCAGEATELCGAGNRIEVYKDSSWVFPQEAQLKAALLQWNASLADALQAADDIRDALQALQAPAKKRRKMARDASPAVIARLRDAGSRFKQARTSASKCQ